MAQANHASTTNLIIFDMPFADVPCDDGAIDGVAEITTAPDGLTWISEIWLAPDGEGPTARPECLDPDDAAYDRIAAAIEDHASGRIDELAARERAARDAA